jgi:hypothetical protein
MFRPAAAVSASLIALCACSGGSGPTGSPSASGRIEAGLAGTWIDNSPFFPDTMIFAENKIRVPFFSAVGTRFSARNGVVKGGPDDEVFGEYVLSGDTLYYDALLLEPPNGVNKATASKYFRQPS